MFPRLYLRPWVSRKKNRVGGHAGKIFREGYQYSTQAQMNKMRAAGYQKSFLPIEEGVTRYVKWLLAGGAA